MSSNIFNILSFLIFIQLLAFNAAIAQVKVQVVSQKISESVEWKEGMSLQLNAERAEIYCTTHASNTIDFEVTFIAKHENREIAESDLKKMKWINEKLSNKVFLRNYIELERSDSKPESDIKTIYIIKVPVGCGVELSNYFGKVKVENISSRLSIKGEFSTITLNNISGKTSIKSTFGDITAQEINGILKIESNRSDINLSNISGTLDIHANLAEVTLSGIKEIKEIKIDAKKSKLKIVSNEINRFSVFLDLFNAELEKPEVMKFDFSKDEKETKKASFNVKEDHPLIAIELNIGSLIFEH